MTKNKGKKKTRRNLAKKRILTAEFPFGKEVKHLLSEIRSIPDDAIVKEVFLWELVRNAATALYRVRRESLVDKDKYGDTPELFIHIVPDMDNHTLSVIDSGIGMTRDDLVSKLGAIVSVTRLNKYLGTIDKYSTLDVDVDLSCICSADCRFGLGFYSAYMVADKVVITTKKTDHDEQYVWEFDANENHASFTVAARDTFGGSDTLDRGTKVTLHLKKSHTGYLKESKLQDMVNKYPKVLCPYPISILVSDENKNPIEKQIVLDDDDDNKEKQERLELLEERYECLRKLFAEFIADMAKNVKVVVCDRVFDLPCYLSVDESKFKINPRHPVMEKIREAFEANPKNKELKHNILLRFEMCLTNIKLYDERHGTSFYENVNKTLGLRDDYAISSDEEDNEDNGWPSDDEFEE